VSFRQLIAGVTDRIEVVVRFLAILELFKQGRVDLDQAERFGEITVTWNNNPDGADLAPIDNYDG
jgi:segregation and condensation protein A